MTPESSKPSDYRCETCAHNKTQPNTILYRCRLRANKRISLEESVFIEYFGCASHSNIPSKRQELNGLSFVVTLDQIHRWAEYDYSAHDFFNEIQKCPQLAEHDAAIVQAAREDERQRWRDGHKEDLVWMTSEEEEKRIREDERKRMLDTLHTSLSARITELKSWIKIDEINNQKKRKCELLGVLGENQAMITHIESLRAATPATSNQIELISGCTWIYDSFYSYYHTSCGNDFETIDGDIEENNFKYCPYCGKTIRGDTTRIGPEKKDGE